MQKKGNKEGRFNYHGLWLALIILIAGQSIAAQQQKRYDFRGVVKSVDAAKKRATIQHEKVGDYMEAMTMPFLIKDEKALKEMKAGDQIEATLVVTDDGGQWLEKIRITASSISQEPAKEKNPLKQLGELGLTSTPAPPPRFDGDASGLYTCSMHLGIRAKQPGKCPRCGMTLVSTIPEIEEEFNLEMNASPKMPQPGQPLNLKFSVFNPRTGAKVKEFGVMHDRLFHLFLVSQDLRDFQHIHPRQLADGSFTIETTLKQPGLYKIYADIYPLDGAPQFLQTNITTSGWKGDVRGSQAKLTPDAKLTKTVSGVEVTAGNADSLGVEMKALDAKKVGDLQVELQPETPTIFSGRKVTLKYRLTDASTGEPVRDLIPYLGAWGHLLILSEDQSEALHSHPEEEMPEEADLLKVRGGPELSFDVLFPAPGNYRVWTQFLRGGKLSTVAFDLRVERLR